MSQLELSFESISSVPLKAPEPVQPPAARVQIPEWAHPRAIQERAETALRQAGCPELAKRVVVRWNPRMRSTAGTANHRTWLVKLNPGLIRFGEAEVDVTLRHELAHLLAHYRVGRKRIAPHGPEWKQACADLGIGGEKRCHSLPLPRREIARPYKYRCDGCGIVLARVKPLRRPTACFNCCKKHSKGVYDERFRFQRVK